MEGTRCRFQTCYDVDLYPLEVAGAELEEIVASNDSPTQKLRRAMDAHLTALCEQLDIYTVYLSERRALSGRSHAKVRAEAERHARLLERAAAFVF